MGFQFVLKIGDVFHIRRISYPLNALMTLAVRAFARSPIQITDRSFRYVSRRLRNHLLHSFRQPHPSISIFDSPLCAACHIAFFCQFSLSLSVLHSSTPCLKLTRFTDPSQHTLLLLGLPPWTATRYWPDILC